MFASKDALFAKSSGSYQISRSLRFRSSASAYLSRTFGTPTNNKIWTWSGWVKIGKIATDMKLFSTSVANTPFSSFYIDGNANLSYYEYTGSNYVLTSSQVFRDPSAWSHIAIAMDTTQATSSNRTKFYVNGVQITSSGSYVPQNTNTALNSAIVAYIGQAGNSSGYLDGYLAEVNFIDGQALTPSSFGAFDTNGIWQPAKYTGSYGTNGFYLPFSDNSGTSNNLSKYSEQFDNAYWAKQGATTVTADATTAPNGTTTADKIVEASSSGVFKVYADTTVSSVSGTTYTWTVYAKAAERSWVYIDAAVGADNLTYFNLSNGTIGTTGGSDTYMSAATASIVSVGNGWYRLSVSRTATSTSASIYNQVGVTTGDNVYSYTGTSGNGAYFWGAQVSSGTKPYYIPTTSSAATTLVNNLGADQSNSASSWNFWTPNNISTSSGTTYDSMIDSPTNYADGGNGRGNYCVLNPLQNNATTLSNANLDGSFPSGATLYQVYGTIGISSGKYYWETTINSASPAGIAIGVVKPTANITANNYSSGNAWSYYNINGNKYNLSGAAYGATSTLNDVIGVALDMDAGTITFYKNNVSQGQAFSGLTGILLPYFAGDQGGQISAFTVNFGQRPFAYTPPSGFSALNTQNLPTPTIANGAQYMAATTYTGNGGTLSVTNGGNNNAGTTFQPDFVWVKGRSVAYFNGLYNVLTGVNKFLSSNSTNAENTNDIDGYVSAFNSNGFTLSPGTTSSNTWNQNAATYIGWQWQGGGAPTVDNSAGAGNVPTAGSVKINGANSTSALAGSIAATRISANTSAGFSVVTYTGTGANATVGHGLGVAPSMIIVKCRSTTSDWAVYHKSTTAAGVLWLNLTNAYGAYSAAWNSTEPTSTVFSVGTATATNASSSSTHVAYCFAPVQSFSNAFSFTGNGSTDGVFIYLGFLPRMILLKRTDTTGNWYLWDTARNTYNAFGNELYPNLSNAEASATDLDVLSNGFKLRNSTAGFNASGGTYIGFAWASNPFKYSRGF